jgi:hypothetical protein
MSLSLMLRPTVSRPVCPGIKHARGGLRRDIYYSLTITVLFLWGALSDEKTGLSFVYATVPRQRTPSWIRVPLVSWPYFTVSDLRLPFSSLATTRRVKVEVFDPASTRVSLECRNELSFKPAMRPGCKSPCWAVKCLLLFSVRQSRGNALIPPSVLVSTKRAFSEPMSSNWLFHHNILKCSIRVLVLF